MNKSLTLIAVIGALALVPTQGASAAVPESTAPAGPVAQEMEHGAVPRPVEQEMDHGAVPGPVGQEMEHGAVPRPVQFGISTSPGRVTAPVAVAPPTATPVTPVAEKSVDPQKCAELADAIDEQLALAKAAYVMHDVGFGNFSKVFTLTGNSAVEIWEEKYQEAQEAGCYGEEESEGEDQE